MTIYAVPYLDNSDGTGLNMKQKGTGGAAHVRTTGAPTSIETIILTINGTGDTITDPTAPVTTEIMLVVPTTTGTFKHCRVTWGALTMPYTDGSTGDTPFAVYAQATVNYTDESNAISRLTVADKGASATESAASKECLMISAQFPEANFDVTGTADTIDNIAVGAYPPLDTAAIIPVYIHVVFF